MPVIKMIGIWWSHRPGGDFLLRATLLLMLLAGGAAAQSCLAPERPFVPRDPQMVRDYADIIGRDFELYIRDIQAYFRCLDAERIRAFQEAREVSEEYGRFLGMAE